MTRDTAERIGNEFQDAGYDYTRVVTGDSHRIELTRHRFEGADLLRLMSILVPGGKPIPNIVVSLESRSIVIE